MATQRNQAIPAPKSKSARRRQAKQRRQHGETDNEEKGELGVDFRKCMVCGDDIDPSALFYDCERTADHSQCLPCFAEYVRHCCNYYTAGKMPLRCPVPSCKTKIDDLAIRHLTAAADADEGAPESLWELYQKTQLNAALAELSLSKDETVVYCSVCNKYAEIYPRDYQARATKLSRAFRAWKLDKERGRLERARVDDDKEEAHPTPALSAESTAEGNGGPPVVDDDAVYVVPPPEVNQRPIKIERFQPDPSIELTSDVFQCRTPQCGAKVCVKCGKLAVDGDNEHECKIDAIHELYIEVLDVLTESSIRRCPKCGCAGMKDDMCCHIKCYEPCNQDWCYVCGQAFESQRDYLSHIGWTVLDNGTNKCPRTLEDMYGTKFDVPHGVMKGKAGEALGIFNVVHQRLAIQKFKDGFGDPDLWREMMETKFPSGIWHQRDLSYLILREQMMPTYVKDYKEHLAYVAAFRHRPNLDGAADPLPAAEHQA